MLLIGYRLPFGELCALLNIHADPDADYVEDDDARDKLEMLLLKSVNNTDLTVMELYDGVFYFGLSANVCKKAIPTVMTTREMSERLADMSILFQRELKKVGIFKYLDKRTTRFPEPYVVQM